MAPGTAAQAPRPRRSYASRRTYATGAGSQRWTTAGAETHRNAHDECACGWPGVRDLAAADGLLTSDGTVYPLLNRLRDAGFVTSEWQDSPGERARRYYSITEAGRQNLAAFRTDWSQFSATVAGVLNHTGLPYGDGEKGRLR